MLITSTFLSPYLWFPSLYLKKKTQKVIKILKMFIARKKVRLVIKTTFRLTIDIDTGCNMHLRKQKKYFNLFENIQVRSIADE